VAPPAPGWERQGVRVDVTIVGVPLAQVPGRAAELAALGVDGVFTAEGAHEAFFPLALAASSGLELMTNAAIALPRNPMHLAQAAWDLQELSGGRFRLGLASQIRAHIERRFGLTWSEPVERLRELVLATKAVFATWQDSQPMDFEGRFYRHTLMTPMFDPGPNPFGPPPVLLGALGPKMTRMTAEVADGLLVLPFSTARFLAEAMMPEVDAGLAAAGRSRSDLEMVCGVIVGVGSDEAELARADAGVRGLLGFYSSTPAYRPVLELEGWGERQPEFRARTRAGDWAALGSLVTDEMVGALAVTGDPATCARAIAARCGQVADRVALFLPAAPSDQTLAELVAELHRLGPAAG
jgi:probable F420-dependent oxidoreductase